MLGAHIIISSDGHRSVSSNTFPPTSTTTSVTDSPRCCSKDIEPLEVLEFTLLSSGCQFLTVGAPVKPPWPRFSSRGNTSSPYYCFPMSWEEGLLFSGISIYKYAAGLNKQSFGENGFQASLQCAGWSQRGSGSFLFLKIGFSSPLIHHKLPPFAMASCI